MAATEAPYKRVAIKISGESLAGDHPDPHAPLDHEALKFVTSQIADVVSSGVECLVVVGGGNFFRGRDATTCGLSSQTGDRLGMLGTAQNALALQDLLSQAGIRTEIAARGEVAAVGHDWSTREIDAALSAKAVVIVAGGSGKGGVSSDVPAVSIGADVHVDLVIMSKHGVSAIFSGDPRLDDSAMPITRISASEALKNELRFADRQALELSRERRTAIRVVGAAEPNSIFRAAAGEAVGSLVVPE